MAQARDILDVARERGVVLSIAENYRYFPAVRVAGELVRAGGLGPVNQVWVEFGKARDRSRGPGIRSAPRCWCRCRFTIRRDEPGEPGGGDAVDGALADRVCARGDHVRGRVEVNGEPVHVPKLAKPERAILLEEFAAAVAGAGPVPNPGEDNIRSVALMDAAVESAASVRVVAL